jgi:hypothetical protein
MKLNETKSLDELLDHLLILESLQRSRRVDNPDYNIYEERNIDLTSLPTFGGTQPGDVSCVWSWDATRVLISDGYPTVFVIESRKSYFSNPTTEEVTI